MEDYEEIVDFAAEICQQKILQQPPPKDGHLNCEALWDGWGCWNYTLAGEIAYIDCPEHIAGFDPTKQAFRNCTSAGEWWRAPVTNMTWANYTPCVDLTGIEEGKQVIWLYVSGYSVSIVSIIIALALFTYFKQLQCQRVTIHKNLFVCYILNGVVWILYYLLVAVNSAVLARNPLWCQMIHCLAQYFTTCNFFWMFCEGLYLHTIIVVAFLNGKKLLLACYLIGWVTPLFITALYTLMRALNHDHAVRCWLNESMYSWIIFGSIIATLVLNMLFMLNILRVLITKLRAVKSPDTNHTRKAVRAALILIPLLGLQFGLYPVQPPPESAWYHLYSMVTAAVTSFQGCFVAIIFCYCNGEVIALLRRKWGQQRLMQSGRRNTQVTEYSRSFSLVSQPKIYESNAYKGMERTPSTKDKNCDAKECLLPGNNVNNSTNTYFFQSNEKESYNVDGKNVKECLLNENKHCAKTDKTSDIENNYSSESTNLEEIKNCVQSNLDPNDISKSSCCEVNVEFKDTLPQEQSNVCKDTNCDLAVRNTVPQASEIVNNLPPSWNDSSSKRKPNCTYSQT